jgi:prepilin-type N-terminal cleavage/methylation domain-containing protein
VSYTGPVHRRAAGFTILELMFTIAIIAVLAGIAMPSFFSQSRKAKVAAEVNSVFADLRTRLEQYQLENALYPATETESSTWPATPGTTQQTVFPLPADWLTLKVVLSNQTDLYCGYSWMTGLGGDATNVGPIAAAAPFNFVAPATNWYYLFAHCNIDGDTAIDSYYISDSVNTNVRSLNDGH